MVREIEIEKRKKEERRIRERNARRVAEDKTREKVKMNEEDGDKTIERREKRGRGRIK